MQLDSPIILGNPSESAANLGNLTGAVTVSLENASYATATVTGNVTWTFASPAGSLRGMLLKLTNAGAFTHTFDANVKFPEGTKPTFTTTGVDFVNVFTDDGVTFYVTLAIKDAK